MWTQLDKSFKTSLGLRTTSDSKEFYEEVYDDVLDINSNNVKTDTIPLNDPSLAISNTVAIEKVLLSLIKDITVANDQAWYAFETGERLKNWISPKFGSLYRIRLFDNLDNEIFPTDSSGWLFDYPTGILIFSGSTAGFQKPFKITGYQYTGGFLSDTPVGAALDTYTESGINLTALTPLDITHGLGTELVNCVFYDSDNNQISLLVTPNGINNKTIMSAVSISDIKLLFISKKV